jgi:hypothetical protein
VFNPGQNPSLKNTNGIYLSLKRSHCQNVWPGGGVFISGTGEELIWQWANESMNNCYLPEQNQQQ